MNQDLKISVVIPAYNVEKYISKTVQSVFRQNYPLHEIIVVDDGSSDKTKRILMQYLSLIKYIYQDNKGPSAARNRGIKEATGEYIAFLDADDQWYKNHVSEAVRVFKKEPNILWFSCAYHVIENGRLVKTIRAKAPEYVVNYFKKSLIHDFVHTSSVIIKKEIFDTIGYFNEKFKFGEDLNMWFRIALHSHSIGYSEIVGTAHIEREKSLTYNKRNYDLMNSLKVLCQTDRENRNSMCSGSLLLINKWIHNLIISGIYYQNRYVMLYIYKKWWHRLFFKSKLILLIGLTLPTKPIVTCVLKLSRNNRMIYIMSQYFRK